MIRRDDGSTLPLVVLFAFLSLALVLIVVAATSLYLERKRLFTVADGAALVGAESFDLDDVELTAAGYRPTLDDAAVAASVDSYLAGVNDFTELEVEEAGTMDGRSATVTLSAFWRPPLLTVLLPDGVRIEVTAVARSVFG